MSATLKTASFICELQEPSRNYEHDVYYKADIARWRIPQPNTDCLGIFWNPQKNCLEEIFLRPQSSPPLMACRPTAASLQHFSNLDLNLHVPAFASVAPGAGQGHANTLEVVLILHTSGPVLPNSTELVVIREDEERSYSGERKGKEGGKWIDLWM
ncbi:hypothetical protein B0H11DRAFT_1912812 [Mycena galericulata]|nr:hypothetical protein B0H11DRAFT_1912812 [Mycena galericulata]